MKTFIVIFLTLISLESVYADTGFYDDSRRGWYWYEKEIIPPKPEKKEERRSPVLPKTEDKQTVSERQRPQIDWSQVWYMHPDDFQKLLDDQLKFSVQYPTEENVTKYVALQYVAQNRAKKFQEVWSDVLLNHPSLDMSLVRDATKTASYLEAKLTGNDVRNAVSSINEDYGLVLFISNECVYCEQQIMYTDTFVSKWDWKNYQSINIDERQINKNMFPVETTPELFIVDKSGKASRIAAGMNFPDRIEKSVLNYVNKRQNDGKHYVNPKTIDQTLTPEEAIKLIDKKYN